MKPLYHYTTADRLAMILMAEKITPSATGVSFPAIPAVWLSTAADWEPTATREIIEDGKTRRATLAEMIESAGALARIEIDPRQIAIIEPLRLSERLRIQKMAFESLMNAARNVGANPVGWRAVAGPIPLSAFLRIELSKEHDPLCWVDSAGLWNE